MKQQEIILNFNKILRFKGLFYFENAMGDEYKERFTEDLKMALKTLNPKYNLEVQLETEKELTLPERYELKKLKGGRDE